MDFQNAVLFACGYTRMMRFVFVGCIVFLVMLLAAFPTVDPGTASYVVLQLDAIILAVVFVVLGPLLYACHGRDTPSQPWKNEDSGE